MHPLYNATWCIRRPGLPCILCHTQMKHKITEYVGRKNLFCATESAAPLLSDRPHHASLGRERGTLIRRNIQKAVIGGLRLVFIKVFGRQLYEPALRNRPFQYDQKHIAVASTRPSSCGDAPDPMAANPRTGDLSSSPKSLIFNKRAPITTTLAVPEPKKPRRLHTSTVQSQRSRK